MPKGARRLPDRCVELLAAAELIVHTGDFFGVEAYEAIAAVGPPLVAVRGNVDEPALAAKLPEEASFEYGGHTIAVVHDAGPKQGRLGRMRRRFPHADAVVFGHSHLPLHESAEDGSLQIFNPGSPTERRRAPRHSMGVAKLDGDGALVFGHVWLG